MEKPVAGESVLYRVVKVFQLCKGFVEQRDWLRCPVTTVVIVWVAIQWERDSGFPANVNSRFPYTSTCSWTWLMFPPASFAESFIARRNIPTRRPGIIFVE